MKKTLFIGTLILCAMMLCTTEAKAQTKKQKKAKQEKTEQEEKIKKQLQQTKDIRYDDFERQKKLEELEALRNELLNEQEMALPCSEESNDDAEYFRELGMNESFEMQDARSGALMEAKLQLCKRIQNNAYIIVDNYYSIKKNEKISKQKLKDKCVEQIGALMGTLEKKCEKVRRDVNGKYSAFYTFQIEKIKVLEALVNVAISNDCDEETFRLTAKKTLNIQN